MAGYLAGDVDEWIYIDVADQHPDSMRFIKDCEKTIGKKITVLRSDTVSGFPFLCCANFLSIAVS